MNFFKTALVTSLLFATPGLALAGEISVTDGWSRATPATRSAVVYLTMVDHGAADQLTGVSTPIAAEASLHQSRMDNGIMKMDAVTAISINENGMVRLEPNGYHIMLTGLKQPLADGQSFPLTLTFAHSGTVLTSIQVKPITATQSDSQPMQGMDMSGTNMK